MEAFSDKKIRPDIQKVRIENKINSVVKRKVVSVLSKVVHILRELYSDKTVNMNKLYDGVTDRSERVATFLAVLELTRNGRIGISDDNSTIFFKGRKENKKKSWKSKKNSEQ
jgi:segregation and condensation protein A